MNEEKYFKELLNHYGDKSEEEIVVEAKNGNKRAQEYIISKYEMIRYYDTIFS